MHTPRIHTFTDKEQAASDLAQTLAQECLDAKRPTLLLFSGGSALSVIQYLPLFSDAAFLTLSVVDERADPSGATSNFQELSRTPWFQAMRAAGAATIDPLSSATSFSQEKAQAFEHALRQWQETHKNGLIVALLGMGADGHTAGIFPTPATETFAQLFQSEAWVAAHTVPGAPSYPERLTTTLTFLQQVADRVYVFICGREKEIAWRHLLAQDLALSALPILGIYAMRQPQIFTDLSSEKITPKS